MWSDGTTEGHSDVHIILNFSKSNNSNSEFLQIVRVKNTFEKKNHIWNVQQKQAIQVKLWIRLELDSRCLSLRMRPNVCCASQVYFFALFCIRIQERIHAHPMLKSYVGQMTDCPFAKRGRQQNYENDFCRCVFFFLQNVQFAVTVMNKYA